MREAIFIAMAALTFVSFYTGVPAIARDLNKLGYSRLVALGIKPNIAVIALIAGIVAMGGTLVMMAANAILFAAIITTMVWVKVNKQT